MGRVVCLGQDMKEKWQIAGLNSVMDGRVQADGSIVTIENYSSVVVRNAAGVKLRTQLLNQAVAAQLSPDGDLLILGRQFINQYSKAGNQTWTYRRPNVADIHTGCRLPNGEVLFLTQAQQGNNCFRLDAKGQLIGKGTTIGRLPNINYGYVVTMDLVGSESILICETNRVAEYDLKTGKEKWKYTTNSPTSVQRLPSGNTLVASLPQNRAVEVDPSGDVVWEYRAKDGLTISKAYRR
jgi:outer membrane protein assembly factor BamB